VYDTALLEDVQHGARILAALAALDADPGDRRESDQPLRRALSDELELVSRQVRAGRLARYGSAQLGPVMVELGAGGPTGALALEALEVLLRPADSRRVLPLLQPGLSVPERLERLRVPASDSPANLLGFLRDIVADTDGHWRSTWLRACALHAAAARDVLDQLDLAAALALHDPVIDELLRPGPAGTDSRA
jgi:hypothetical protein